MCLLTNPKHLSFRASWQTPLSSVDQRASLCSQWLIVNEDWCLEGWPCQRFLTGMDTYWSLHFYALLDTHSPLFLMVFWSTLWAALVMIDGIDSDKNKAERMNVQEKEIWGICTKTPWNVSASFLLSSVIKYKRFYKRAFLLSKEMEFGSAQSDGDSCYWAASKYVGRVSDLIYTQTQETWPPARSQLVKYKTLKAVLQLLFYWACLILSSSVTVWHTLANILTSPPLQWQFKNKTAVPVFCGEGVATWWLSGTWRLEKKKDKKTRSSVN